MVQVVQYALRIAQGVVCHGLGSNEQAELLALTLYVNSSLSISIYLGVFPNPRRGSSLSDTVTL